MPSKNPERTYKVEYVMTGGECKGTAQADGPGEALRKLFPKAGAIKLSPAEVIHYEFELEIGNELVKGTIKQARKTKEE